MMKITFLCSLHICVICDSFAETEARGNSAEVIFAEQRDTVIKLAPFILETECVVPGRDEKSAIQSACSLVVCQDGRFIIHRKSDSNTKESRAWDGNGLYYSNTTSDNTDFLPKAAFDTQFDSVVDPRIDRKVPMSDLLFAFGNGNVMDGASVAIPCGPLFIFDYMMTLDRYCSDRPARVNIRWCDVVSDSLFRFSMKLLSPVNQENGHSFSIGENPLQKAIPFRKGTFLDSYYHFKSKDNGSIRRMDTMVIRGPWIAMARGLVLPEAGYRESARSFRTEFLFDYDESIAHGVLPSRVIQNEICDQESTAGKSSTQSRTIAIWSIRRFEHIDPSDADDAIGQYPLLQKNIVDISKRSQWTDRYSKTTSSTSLK